MLLRRSVRTNGRSIVITSNPNVVFKVICSRENVLVYWQISKEYSGKGWD